MTALFLSRKDTKTPFAINLIAISAFILLGSLIGRTQGAIGVMVAIVCCYALLLILQLWLLFKRHGIWIPGQLSKYRFPAVLLLNLCITVALGTFTAHLSLGTVLNCAVGIFVPIVLAGATILLSPSLKHELHSFIRINKKDEERSTQP